MFVTKNLEPEEDDIRVIDTSILDDDGQEVTGKLVQIYAPDVDDDGCELSGGCHWEDLCPLSDFGWMFPLMAEEIPKSLQHHMNA